MGNRAAFQTAQAELPAQILLWGEFQCNQDTDMGNAYSQSVDYDLTETNKETMELFGIGHDGQNYAHALRQLLYFL